MLVQWEIELIMLVQWDSGQRANNLRGSTTHCCTELMGAKDRRRSAKHTAASQHMGCAVAALAGLLAG